MRRRNSAFAAISCVLLSTQIARTCSAQRPAGDAEHSEVNVARIVARSDIILQRPNVRPEDAMPLGNGRLGAAVWAQDGMTIQLNRADTLPGRLSPGQVVIPGLARLTAGADYAGRVDLFNGQFNEHGGGMSATVYIEPDSDVVIVAVTGADPAARQTAEVHLWAPRRPLEEHQNGLALLAETWTDASAAGATGRTFGSLAAITARARDVRPDSHGRLAAGISFLPESDGSFRVLIAAPVWAGGDAVKAASSLLSLEGNRSSEQHQRWWNNLWKRAGLMKLKSQDGSAEYFENLRLIDLFVAAAESRGALPGSQAGVADLFSAFKDFHQWDPSAYWHWNLRMQVAANLGAGLLDLNEPYFRLYRDNLHNIEDWTKNRMQRRPGACVPETMRFNGQGFENETWTKAPGRNCDAGSPPYYNARTLSTGAEVGLWIWQQYLVSSDRTFLAANYPVMAAAARFLLAYSHVSADGLRHTFPSNAHENQWDVHDPTTDICAMTALLPAVIEAAKILHRDADLVEEANAALRQIPPFPRTDLATLKQQLTPADDTAARDAIAQSYDQGAAVHNTENIGLEPVWPYGLIGDQGDLHDLAVRTFRSRPNKEQNDWSFDPIQAARLGLASEVKSSLLKLTAKYQAYPSGFANFVRSEFYGEQIGVVAAALEEALVQDYDGLVRIAPAWPREWDADGVVNIQHNSKIDVQIRHGEASMVTLESGFSGTMRFRNPWQGQAVEILSGNEDRVSAADVKGPVIEFQVESGKAYSLRKRGTTESAEPFLQTPGEVAVRPKHLGTRSIGLGPTVDNNVNR